MKYMIEFLYFNDNIYHNLLVTVIICSVVIFLCYILGSFLDCIKNEKNNIDFAHKHTWLNIIQCLAILLIILSVFGGFIIYVCKSFMKVFSESPRIDKVIVVALITGILSIISNISSKYFEYRKSRQEYLAQKREKSYGQFIDMVYKIQRNADNPNSYTNEMMLEDLAKFSKEITLWGSSEVVKKWDEFRLNGNKSGKEQDNLFVLEDIMNAMRKDLGVKKTKQGELLAFFVNDIKEVIEKRKK